VGCRAVGCVDPRARGNPQQAWGVGPDGEVGTGACPVAPRLGADSRARQVDYGKLIGQKGR